MDERTLRLARAWRGGLTVAVFALAPAALAQLPEAPSVDECHGCNAQFAATPVAGTWSSALTAAREPGWALADFYCFAACTIEGRANSERLLAGPGTALELYPRAAAANIRSVERLLRNAVDSSRHSRSRLPGFSCDRPGFAEQVVSPLPLQIATQSNRVTLRYEELGVERTIALVGDAARPRDAGTPFGSSSGRFERGAFIVETSGIAAGRLSSWLGSLEHSDALRATERYSVSADGRWLDLELILDDPNTFAEPLVITKRWLRTPQASRRQYGCDVMSAGLSGVFAEYLDPRVIDARRPGLRH